MMKQHLLAVVVGLAAWSAAGGLCGAAPEPGGAAAPPAESAAAAKASTANAADGEGLPLRPEKSPAPPLGNTKDNDMNRLVWESLAAVIIILALGGAGMLLVRRVMPRLRAATGKQIALLETMHISPQKTVHLLQVGDRCLLVAASRENFCFLADVTGAVPRPSAGEDPSRPKAKFVIPDLPDATDQRTKP